MLFVFQLNLMYNFRNVINFGFGTVRSQRVISIRCRTESSYNLLTYVKFHAQLLTGLLLWLYLWKVPQEGDRYNLLRIKRVIVVTFSKGLNNHMEGLDNPLSLVSNCKFSFCVSIHFLQK